jgi:hypothetical protein
MSRVHVSTAGTWCYRWGYACLRLRAGSTAMDEIRQKRGCFERGTSFRSRDELIEALRRWLIECDDATVGDDSVYGGTPWLHFETSAGSHGTPVSGASSASCVAPRRPRRASSSPPRLAKKAKSITARSDGARPRHREVPTHAPLRLHAGLFAQSRAGAGVRLDTFRSRILSAPFPERPVNH